MSERTNESYKVVVAGLDKAGKTSILNILNRKYNLMDDIKPTVGISRSTISILGVPIVSFDLGGQERYRNDYIKDEHLFEFSDSLFFVIDAMDASRHELALQYYKDILSIVNSFKDKPKIAICIHKVDPNVRNIPEVTSAIEEIKKLFQSISEGHEVSIFVTSIYDQRSIVQAFSSSLQELISTLKPLKNVMTSLVRILRLDGAILFDENMMILSDFYLSEEIEKIFLETVYNSTYYIRNVNPQMVGGFSTSFELIMDFHNQQKRFNFVDVAYRGWKLSLLTMGKEKHATQTLQKKFSSLLDTI